MCRWRYPSLSDRSIRPGWTAWAARCQSPASGAARARQGYSRPVRAVATADGFALVAGTSSGAERGNGRWSLDISEDGAVVSVDYDYSPLRLAGGLGLFPAKAPYKAIVGGVLMFSFGAQGGKGLYGTGMGAYVVPESGAAKPSFFGYVGIGGDPGIGIPAIRVTGISAGLGWNSRIRIPEIAELGELPVPEGTGQSRRYRRRAR